LLLYGQGIKHEFFRLPLKYDTSYYFIYKIDLVSHDYNLNNRFHPEEEEKQMSGREREHEENRKKKNKKEEGQQLVVQSDPRRLSGLGG
jgi:hypothetical protein